MDKFPPSHGYEGVADSVARKPTRRYFLLSAAAFVSSLSGCTTIAVSEIANSLAPTGKLRIGVYPGSPTSMIEVGTEMRGLTVDIGNELARRLGVPAEIVVFQRVAEVVEAIRDGHADFTITNATLTRAQEVDFTPPLVALELGYLVAPGSRVVSISSVDQPNMRVGVTQGSTSQSTLSRALQNARIVATPSLQTAGQMLARGELDAFATNKAILFELSDAIPGTQILSGNWGLEHLAIATSKNRGPAVKAYLRSFAQSVQDNGMIETAATRAQLRGMASSP